VPGGDPEPVSEAILAAGAVVWRPASHQPDAVEVLLVHRPKYDDWSLPKGKREPGEHVLLTVVREVHEETSVRPVLGPRLRTVEYLVGARPKQVDYWSAISAGDQAAASHEIDAVAWLPWPAERGRLSYTHDADVIASLRPRRTVPLILVRHASAGQKGSWPGDDLLRPLDAEGAMDAVLLADLLSCFAPRARVISSAAQRCIQTVHPYAAAFGGSVEAEAALAVPGADDISSGLTDQADSLRHLVRGLVADAEPAVLCLHRENLPVALAAACSALGSPRPEPGSEPSLPKGAFYVVHVAAGELAGLERYELS
jgi:8-oxo-(d)GTP phosphatase